MELIEINKKSNKKAEIKLKFADEEKRYEFSYTNGEIFTVNFPEELRKILRLLPVSITHSLVEKVENFLTSDTVNFPIEMEIEREILQLV